MPNQINHISNNNNSQRQLDDLIGLAPNWLLNSGITLVFVVVSVILVLAAFIKYPDKIVAKGLITSEFPPIEHYNVNAGIIEHICVKNGDYVIEDEIIIYIKNSVIESDLMELKAFMEEFRSIRSFSNCLHLKFPKRLHLGELQNEYSQLDLAFHQFQLTLQQIGVSEQIKTINSEIKSTVELRRSLLAAKKSSSKELSLVKRDLERNTQLNKDGVISDLERELKEREFLNYEKQYNNLDRGLIQNKIRKEQLTLESLQLREKRYLKLENQNLDVLKYIHLLNAKITEWDKKYILRTEIDGNIVLSSRTFQKSVCSK